MVYPKDAPQPGPSTGRTSLPELEINEKISVAELEQEFRKLMQKVPPWRIVESLSYLLQKMEQTRPNWHPGQEENYEKLKKLRDVFARINDDLQKAIKDKHK